jgi:CspA family cold shock protein
MASSSEESTVYFGQVKWFNKNKNFGFITIITNGDGEFKGQDIFVHQRNINAVGYRTLSPGEYVQFNRTENDNESTKTTHPFHATQVSGIYGGKLMCEIRNDYWKSRNNDDDEDGNDNDNGNGNGGFKKVYHSKNNNRRQFTNNNVSSSEYQRSTNQRT